MTSTMRPRRSRRMTRLLAVAAIALGLVAAPTIPASAGGWTTVATRHGAVMVACKTSINSIYGPLYRVTLGAANPSDHTHIAGATVHRGDVNGPVVHSYQRTLRPGDWPPNGTVYLSPLLNDVLVVGMGEANGQGAGGPWSMSAIANC